MRQRIMDNLNGKNPIKVILKPGEFISTNEAWQVKHVEFQEMKAQLTEKIKELEREVKRQKEITQEEGTYLRNVIQNNVTQLNTLNHENKKLENRLDSALYAMVIFKDIIAQLQQKLGIFKYNIESGKGSWSLVPAKSDDDVKLAV